MPSQNALQPTAQTGAQGSYEALPGCCHMDILTCMAKECSQPSMMAGSEGGKADMQPLPISISMSSWTLPWEPMQAAHIKVAHAHYLRAHRHNTGRVR